MRCGLEVTKYPSLWFLNRHAKDCGTTRFGAFPDAWLLCDYPGCRQALCCDMYGDPIVAAVLRGWDPWLHKCRNHLKY